MKLMLDMFLKLPKELFETMKPQFGDFRKSSCQHPVYCRLLMDLFKKIIYQGRRVWDVWGGYSPPSIFELAEFFGLKTLPNEGPKGLGLYFRFIK